MHHTVVRKNIFPPVINSHSDHWTRLFWVLPTSKWTHFETVKWSESMWLLLESSIMKEREEAYWRNVCLIRIWNISSPGGNRCPRSSIGIVLPKPVGRAHMMCEGSVGLVAHSNMSIWRVRFWGKSYGYQAADEKLEGLKVTWKSLSGGTDGWVSRRFDKGGDLLRFVPNIKNGVEIKFHCDSDSLGQMWLIGIGHWQNHWWYLLFELLTCFTGLTNFLCHTVQISFWHSLGQIDGTSYSNF